MNLLIDRRVYDVDRKLVDFRNAGSYVCLLVLLPFFDSLGVEDACYIAGEAIYGGNIGKQFAKYLINLTEYQFDECFQPLYWTNNPYPKSNERITRDDYLISRKYTWNEFYLVKSACEREEQKRREEQAQEKERQTREEERSIYHSKDFF